MQPLPKCLRGDSKNLFQLLPNNKDITANENEWLNLSENKHLALEDFLEDFMNSVNWNNLDYAEIIAEQLHNIADSINKSYVFNICWVTDENAQCIESSDNIAIHGALKRLQKWNKASLTFVCHSDKLWYITHGISNMFPHALCILVTGFLTFSITAKKTLRTRGLRNKIYMLFPRMRN